MAWKKSTLKHSQTFSRAKFDFMDMLLMAWKTSAFKRSQTFRFFAQGSRAKNCLRLIHGYALNACPASVNGEQLACGVAGSV
jgi:hypothetical protein